MGVDDLVVAGSHGFDIWSPEGGAIEHQAAAGYKELLDRVTAQLRDELDSIEGALVEPKKASVAAHYRLVSEQERPAVEAAVERLLADHPEELKVTPGKMVYELCAAHRLAMPGGISGVCQITVRERRSAAWHSSTRTPR